MTPRPATLILLGDDGATLTVRLRASTVVRLSETEVWVARTELLARFTSSPAVSEEEAAFFANSSGLYVLWPFARAALDGVARLAGVEVTPLPLLVRPTPTRR